MLNFWRNLPIWQKILIAVITGSLTGLLLGQHALFLKPLGILFVNAIRMLIVPVIFTASLCAVLSMDNLKSMGFVSVKALGIYLISMLVAALIGVCVAEWISPGSGLLLKAASDQIPHAQSLPSFGNIIESLIPSNPVSAFLEANILQILIFSVFLGAAINLSGEKGYPVKNFFHSFSSVMMKFTNIVISFSPYGVFALMASTVGEFGISTLVPLFKLILTAYVADIGLLLVFYFPLLFFYLKENPFRFLKNISEALLFAFGSSSSAATLPISLRCAENNLGASKQLAGFLLPLGISFNMNGLAIYVAIASIFTANIFGIHLSLMQYVILIITIAFTSMGAAGIPGSALVVMGAVMSAMGLPLAAIPLIAGVDRMIDMAQTTTNVASDLFATFLIAKQKTKQAAKAEVVNAPQSLSN